MATGVPYYSRGDEVCSSIVRTLEKRAWLIGRFVLLSVARLSFDLLERHLDREGKKEMETVLRLSEDGLSWGEHGVRWWKRFFWTGSRSRSRSLPFEFVELFALQDVFQEDSKPEVLICVARSHFRRDFNYEVFAFRLYDRDDVRRFQGLFRFLTTMSGTGTGNDARSPVVEEEKKERRRNVLLRHSFEVTGYYGDRTHHVTKRRERRSLEPASRYNNNMDRNNNITVGATGNQSQRPTTTTGNQRPLDQRNEALNQSDPAPRPIPPRSRSLDEHRMDPREQPTLVRPVPAPRLSKLLERKQGLTTRNGVDPTSSETKSAENGPQGSDGESVESDNSGTVSFVWTKNLVFDHHTPKQDAPTPKSERRPSSSRDSDEVKVVFRDDDDDDACSDVIKTSSKAKDFSDGRVSVTVPDYSPPGGADFDEDCDQNGDVIQGDAIVRSDAMKLNDVIIQNDVSRHNDVIGRSEVIEQNGVIRQDDVTGRDDVIVLDGVRQKSLLRGQESLDSEPEVGKQRKKIISFSPSVPGTLDRRDATATAAATVGSAGGGGADDGDGADMTVTVHRTFRRNRRSVTDPAGPTCVTPVDPRRHARPVLARGTSLPVDVTSGPFVTSNAARVRGRVVSASIAPERETISFGGRKIRKEPRLADYASNYRNLHVTSSPNIATNAEEAHGIPSPAHVGTTSRVSGRTPPEARGSRRWWHFRSRSHDGPPLVLYGDNYGPSDVIAQRSAAGTFAAVPTVLTTRVPAEGATINNGNSPGFSGALHGRVSGGGGGKTRWMEEVPGKEDRWNGPQLRHHTDGWISSRPNRTRPQVQRSTSAEEFQAPGHLWDRNSPVILSPAQVFSYSPTRRQGVSIESTELT